MVFKRTSIHRILQISDAINGTTPTTTTTVDQNLAVYIYIFLGGMTLIGLLSLVIYCYHHRKLQRFVENDNLNNNMQRHSLIDSFVESDQWQCSICYHSNHPARKECLMCGTKQIISEQNMATPLNNIRRQSYHNNGIDSGLIFETNSMYNNTIQAARQRSFHVRRLNELNQRQKSAIRRNLWLRKRDEKDGMYRWIRNNINNNNYIRDSFNNDNNNNKNDKNKTITFSNRSFNDKKEKLGVGLETELIMAANDIKDDSTDNNNNNNKHLYSGIIKRSRSKNSSELINQKSVGFVRHFDETTGKVKWVPADTIRISENCEVNMEEFPRASAFIDFEAIAALNFNQKVRWFLQEVEKIAVPWEEGHLLLKIRRENILQESMHLLMLIPASDLRQKLRIEFLDEPGLDAGGLLREWLLIITKKIFNKFTSKDDKNMTENNSNDEDDNNTNNLFTITHNENLAYFINKNSITNDQTNESKEKEIEVLKCYEFIGRLVAKCLIEGQILAVHFAIPLLKHILGVPISFSDLEFLDEQLYNNMNWLREQAQSNNNIESLCLDFTVININNNNSVETIELIPNGSNVNVTHENINDYLLLLLKYYCYDSINKQLESFLKGLYDVIPRYLLLVFDYQELSLLLSGIPYIDVNDWQKHTDYKYINSSKPNKLEKKNVIWFWDILNNHFNQEDRAKLLQFVTGTSRVPVEGFKGLVSNDGKVRRFGIQFVSNRNHSSSKLSTAGLFPKAHTCFNRLDMPIYNNKDEMLTYLTLVINMEITGFTMQ